MAKRDPAQTNAPNPSGAAKERNWRTRFLDHLAESSNVTRSAEQAGVDVSRVYRLKRAQPDFARQWQAALSEGYGPTTGPVAAWSVSEARLQMLQQERSALLDAHGPGPIWVRQVGTFDQSRPLLLAHLN